MSDVFLVIAALILVPAALAGVLAAAKSRRAWLHFLIAAAFSSGGLYLVHAIGALHGISSLLWPVFAGLGYVLYLGMMPRASRG